MSSRLGFWARLIGASAIVSSMAAAAVAQDMEKRVAVMLAPTQDAFVGTWASTFQAAAEERGMQVSIFSSPYDAALQTRQIDDAIGQSFDALVVQPLSTNAIIPALGRARDAGIPVLTVISQLPGDWKDIAVAYVGEDSRNLGALAGEAMANALKAAGKTEGKVAAITGSLADAIAPLRLEGFRESLSRLAPGFEVVAVEDVRWSPVEGEKAAGQLLVRFAAQGGLDGIYGMNDRLANATIQAAQAAGYSVGTGADDLIVVGGNCQAIGIQNLQAGNQAATVRMLPTVTGAQAAEVLDSILAGQDVEPVQYEVHKIVTPENMGDVAEACSY